MPLPLLFQKASPYLQQLLQMIQQNLQQSVQRHQLFHAQRHVQSQIQRHVYQMFHALPTNINKHLFFHNGAHVYMNNWQSIDFRESMNALLSKKLLGYDSSYELPTVIWQDNTGEQSWTSLDDFGNQTSQRTFLLGDDEKVIQNRYATEDTSAMARLIRPS